MAVPTPTYTFHDFDGGASCCGLIAESALIVGTAEGQLRSFCPSTYVELCAALYNDDEKRGIISCGSFGERVFVHVRSHGVLLGTIDRNGFDLQETIPSAHFGFCRIACGESLVVPDYERGSHYLKLVNNGHTSRIGPLNAKKAPSKEGSIPAPMAIGSLNEDCCLVAVGFEDGLIEVYNVKERSLVFSVSAFAEAIFGMSFDHGSRSLAVSTAKSPIKIFLCEPTGALTISREIEFQEWNGICSSLAFSPGGKLLAAGFENGFVRIYTKKSSKRFDSLFGGSVERFVLAGNHDIGFHYAIFPQRVAWFARDFNRTMFVDHVTVKGNHFVLLNSMSMKRDGCRLCAEAEDELKKLSSAFNCAKRKQENCRYSIGAPYPRPILMQYFPLLRKDDTECADDLDLAPEKLRSAPFREK